MSAEEFAPTPPAPAEENIDVSRLAVGIVPINNDLSNRAEVMALGGLQSSYLEGAIWEEMQSQQGISAAKALLLSKHNGQTLYTVTAGNVDSVLANVNLSSDVEDEIRGAVAQGRIAIIPSANISVNRWSGTGYILRDPQTGAATYPISGGMAGGSTTGGQTEGVPDSLGSEVWTDNSPLGPAFLILLWSLTDGFIGSPASAPSGGQSDPVNVSTGNMYRTFNDVSWGAQGIPIAFTRTYNSRAAYNGAMGFGWTFTYGEMLYATGDGAMVYRESDGSEHSGVDPVSWTPDDVGRSPRWESESGIRRSCSRN